MRRPATGIDYVERIEAVVTYMHQHVGDDLSLDRLAEIACFSRYHFHRIYRELMGETPDQTLRRLRLHQAAAMLVHGDRPLAEIARTVRYGSPEAFSRAFAQAYGQAPSAFRHQRQGPTAFDAQAHWRTPQESDMYHVTIETYDAFTLAGLPHQGDYNTVGEAFERVCARAGQAGLMGPSTRSIGVYYDDPDTVPTADLRAFAGIVLEAGQTAPDGLETLDIPAGHAARLVFQGPYADLHQPYRYLYGTWLPESGHEPADQPAFEEYLNDCRELPPTEWLTAIMVPLILSTAATGPA